MPHLLLASLLAQFLRAIRSRFPNRRTSINQLNAVRFVEDIGPFLETLGDLDYSLIPGDLLLMPSRHRVPPRRATNRKPDEA